MLRTNRLLSLNLSLINKQTLRAIAIQKRCLTTDQKEPQPQQPAPEKYGNFRSPPTSLGVNEPPVVDYNNWLQRKKQKLRDFVDYEKAFAAHAAERRYL
jgi:ATPase complex subunit ATP10